MPFVKVVFPLPRSPVSKMSIGAVNRFANSRPHAVVSSDDRVTISSATELNLLQHPLPRLRNCLRDLMRKDARGILLAREYVSGRSVKENPKRQDAQPVVRAELRRQRSKHSRQHVSRAALCQARPTGRIDENTSIRSSKYRVVALQNNVGLPFFGRFRRRFQSIVLHVGVFHAKKPSHLTRMRRYCQKLRFSLPQ